MKFNFNFKWKRKPKVASVSISKKKDSLIGIPVLFTLAGISPVRNGLKPDKVKKIGILKVSSVRDTIFTKTIISVLKQVYPGVSITFFAGERNFIAASDLAGVDVAIRLFHSNLSKSIKLVKSAGAFDLWIDFGVWSRFEAIMSQTANAKYKIGFKSEGEHRHFPYDKIVPYAYEKHIIKNMFNLVSLLGIDIKEAENNQRRSSVIDDKLIVIHIFSDDVLENNRKWSHQNWKSIVEFLNKKGYKIALIGAKKDIEESEIFNELAGSNAEIEFFVGRLDFADTCKLLSKARLVISADTSILHIAAYLGTTVLGLYGPTPVEQYCPIGSNVNVIASTACFGCQNIYGDETCHMGEPDCMDSITVERVEDKLKEILGEEDNVTSAEEQL